MFKCASGGLANVIKEELGFLADNAHPTDYFPRNLINKEQPMNVSEIRSLKPGDEILVNCHPNYFESVFIGIDPMNTDLVMYRKKRRASLGTAPILIAHNANIYPAKNKEHVIEVFIDKYNYAHVIKEWQSKSDLTHELKNKDSRKVIDAKVTPDGLLIIKYIDEPVEEAAILAAYDNPTVAFN